MRKGQQIALTPFEAADSPILFKWINEREQVLFNAPYRPVHEMQHETWFANVQRRPDMVIFAIRLLSDRRLIGTCQLHDIHPIHRSAELQIRIADVAARGGGCGTEAVRLLLEFAFDDLNLHRVFLHVFADNAAARRVYDKAGFATDGVLRQAVFVNGEYRDLILMSILRRDRGSSP